MMHVFDRGAAGVSPTLPQLGWNLGFKFGRMPTVAGFAAALLLLLLRLGAAAAVTHYEVLGVAPTASRDQLKAAFRRFALRDHPDKIHRHKDKAAAQRRFERANEAFSVLIDPDQRSRYDQLLAFGAEQSGGPQRASTASRSSVVRLSVPCTLHELGGWRPAPVNLASLAKVAGKHPTLSPRVLWSVLMVDLPPGSFGGDVVKLSDTDLGVDVELELSEILDPRFTRRGDELQMTVHLPCWHNACGAPAVRVRAICGTLLQVCARGRRVSADPDGEVVRVPDYGMPRCCGVKPGGRPEECSRGDLHVRLRLRTVSGTLVQMGARAACVVGGAVAVRLSARHAVGALGAMGARATKLAGQVMSWVNASLERANRPRPSRLWRGLRGSKAGLAAFY